MRVEVISTGTELLLGEIVNTNFQYLSVRLNELGFDVLYETTVGDNYNRMKDTIKNALERVDIIITSGGLGPTQGDITKEVSADVFDDKLILNAVALEKVKYYFEHRNIVMPQSNEKQALMPKTAEILDNSCGTAPGVWLEKNGKIIINLPGPPRELKTMFENEVVPRLKAKFGDLGTIYSHTFKSFGLGESTVAELLHDLIKEQSNPTIALYARSGDILIRITAKAESKEKAYLSIKDISEQVKNKVKTIYGENDDTLESVLGKELTKNNLTISFAESCTGGLTSSMLSDISGSSDYFLGSVVSYSNNVKENILKVDKSVLSSLGAVSDKVALQMASGVRETLKSDVGVSITGIAGPNGGSEDKPVGTVYIAVNFQGKEKVQKYIFSGNRTEIKMRSAKTALAQVLKTIKQKGDINQ